MPNRKEFASKISIILELKQCINTDTENQITFIITNNNGSGIWIHAYNLILNRITNKDNEYITPLKLEEYTAPNIPEYFWINPNSKIKISFFSGFFQNFSLLKGVEYYLYSNYDKYAQPKGKEMTLTDSILINKVSFKLCE